MGAAVYPDRYSRVIVIYTDGEVQEFPISASPFISMHLARTASETGILQLLADGKSWNIPVVNIRSYEIEEISADQYRAMRGEMPESEHQVPEEADA